MTQHARGTFEARMTPATVDGDAQDASLGRFVLDKQFHGDLEATSRGQMLTAGASVPSSAGYVAIERVTGTLAGRTGAFTLQHTGLMTRGAPELTVIIVPDSGSGQLTGLAGDLTKRGQKAPVFSAGDEWRPHLDNTKQRQHKTNILVACKKGGVVLYSQHVETHNHLA